MTEKEKAEEAQRDEIAAALDEHTTMLRNKAWEQLHVRSDPYGAFAIRAAGFSMLLIAEELRAVRTAWERKHG